MLQHSIKIILSFLLLVLSACQSNDKPPHYHNEVRIGGGPPGHIYHVACNFLTNALNEKSDIHSHIGKVEITEGSAYNINAVMLGKLDFGLCQADDQYDTVNGHNLWEGQPQSKLRFICNLHSEAITFIAADDANISSLKDVHGKIIGVGTRYSGTYSNALDCLSSIGLKAGINYTTVEIDTTEAIHLLSAKKIDGFFCTVGHPCLILLQTVNMARPIHFVPIANHDTLTRHFPYYINTTIPVALYAQISNKENVPTIGMSSTLVSSSDVSDDVVYHMVKALFENFECFKKWHPCFTHLSSDQALSNNLAPFHPGALRYYEEKGLLPTQPKDAT